MAQSPCRPLLPAAFSAAQEYRPDVVLLDIGLPKADGYMVAQRMRGEAWGQLAVLVATTGWGQSSDMEKAQRAGFYHHLVKPVDPNALKSILAQATLH